MSSSIMRGCFRAPATQFARESIQRFPSHHGSHLPQSDLTPITRRNFMSLNAQEPSQKHKYWPKLCAFIVAGIFSQQLYAFSKKKIDEELHLKKWGIPVACLSSGAYKACYYNPIPQHIVQKMMGKSYKEGCPIPLADLAYVVVPHYDMNGKICSGELVVHKNIADKVMLVFKNIFLAEFPIDKMRLIDDYHADDDLSMENNNSSAFCFRHITGRPGFTSYHGLGLAIDLNPLLNPYIKGHIICPKNAEKYADRTLQEPGMIHAGDAVVTAFKIEGFEYGGDWESLKDYQHFQFDKTKVGMTKTA